MKSPSYKQASCCYHCDCDYLDTNDNEPCWGEVEVVDEIYYEDAPDYGGWVHLCEGHQAKYNDGKYLPENKQ